MGHIPYKCMANTMRCFEEHYHFSLKIKCFGLFCFGVRLSNEAAYHHILNALQKKLIFTDISTQITWLWTTNNKLYFPEARSKWKKKHSMFNKHDQIWTKWVGWLTKKKKATKYFVVKPPSDWFMKLFHTFDSFFMILQIQHGIKCESQATLYALG